MNSGASVPGPLAGALRLAGAQRPHALSIPALSPADTSWVVVTWHGHEAIGPIDPLPGPLAAEYWVDILTPMPDLSAALGQPATLATQTADGYHELRSGLVASVERRGGDHRAVRHRLHLVPWTWLLTHGRHSRVFQDADVLAMVEAVLTAYAPWAAWQVSGDVAPFLSGRPRRRGAGPGHGGRAGAMAGTRQRARIPCGPGVPGAGGPGRIHARPGAVAGVARRRQCVARGAVLAGGVAARDRPRPAAGAVEPGAPTSADAGLRQCLFGPAARGAVAATAAAVGARPGVPDRDRSRSRWRDPAAGRARVALRRAGPHPRALSLARWPRR